MNQGGLLSAQGVSYGGILRNIDIEWQKGQMIGLVGPNGAGKSTLLRILAGIYRPTYGFVQVGGQQIAELSSRSRAKRIAYLPQHLPENVAFTVEQYVEMGRFAYRTVWGGLDSDSRLAVQHAMALLHLFPYRHVRLDQISGGERQRAGVARCLAQGSPIILLDEPIANLDVHYQLDILHYLRLLAAQGHLVVIAIHHLELAARYCHRLLLLSEGTVYDEGNPQDVLSEQSLYEVFQVEAKTYRDPFEGYLRVSYSS